LLFLSPYLSLDKVGSTMTTSQKDCMDGTHFLAHRYSFGRVE
jgi:hypothetical protein